MLRLCSALFMIVLLVIGVRRRGCRRRRATSRRRRALLETAELRMLDEPRLLLERALDPLNPPLSPNAPRLLAAAAPREIPRCRCGRAPPLRCRAAGRSPTLAPDPAAEIAAAGPVARRRVVPTAPLRHVPPCRCTCCRAPVCRCESESPRAVPPYRLAVARSRYGAPPRCSGRCCQLPRALTLVLPARMFALRLKLLLLLMLMSLLPQPAPQPQPPPPQNAPIATPTPNDIATAPPRSPGSRSADTDRRARHTRRPGRTPGT